MLMSTTAPSAQSSTTVEPQPIALTSSNANLITISSTPLIVSPLSLTPQPAPSVPIPSNGVDYRHTVVLAPMVRSSELPSRLLALHYGASLVWGPETVDRSIIGATRRINPRTGCVEITRVPSHGGQERRELVKENVIYSIDPRREKGKLVFQLGTSDAGRAVQAASLVASDVSGIDVNAGCPKSFSTDGGMGAALLKEPKKLAGILEALVEKVGKVWQIGISVKIRLLKTEEETKRLVERLVRTGITGLTVHCRTKEMRPRERAIRGQLRMVGELCRVAGVACVMNGDITSRDEAEVLVKEYGVDGAMIATAAEKNASCFRRASEGGLAGWREVAVRHLDFAMQVEHRWGATKFSLSQIVPGKQKEVYQGVVRSAGYEECCGVLEVGEEMLRRGREVDIALGLDEREEHGRRKKKRESEVMVEVEKRVRMGVQHSQPPEPAFGFRGLGQAALTV